MATLALEINDAGILAVGEPGSAAEELAPSPGYALFEGDRLLVGLEALQRARLKPRLVHNRFWSQLDTTPLARPFSRDLSTADLAHAHLAEIWRSLETSVDDVLLAVPASITDRQLGLILGIARACGMPVTGMVDAAIAAAVRGYPGKKLLHLDLELHRLVLTELSQGLELERQRVEVVDDVGLAPLQDAWAKLIARVFVRETRFDPLHAAATEQSLYILLPDWLAELRSRDSATLVLEGSAREHTIELSRQRLVAAVDTYYQRLTQLVSSLKRAGEPVTLLLSHRIAELPEAGDRLAEVRDLEIVILPRGAAAAGALRERAAIRSAGESIPFITRLRSRFTTPPAIPEAPPDSDGNAPPSLGVCPTHVLYNGRAYPITLEPFTLGVAIAEGIRGINLSGATAGISRSHCSIYRQHDQVVVEDHSSYGSFVNGERIEGRASLATGDRLRLGTPGIEVELIAVLEDHGTS